MTRPQDYPALLAALKLIRERHTATPGDTQSVVALDAAMEIIADAYRLGPDLRSIHDRQWHGVALLLLHRLLTLFGATSIVLEEAVAVACRDEYGPLAQAAMNITEDRLTLYIVPPRDSGGSAPEVK